MLNIRSSGRSWLHLANDARFITPCHPKGNWPFIQRSFKLFNDYHFGQTDGPLDEAKAAGLRSGTAAHLSPFCWRGMRPCPKYSAQQPNWLGITAKRDGWKTAYLTKLSVSGGFCRSQSCWQSSLKQVWGCWSRWTRQTKSSNPVPVAFCALYPEKNNFGYWWIERPNKSRTRVLPLCTPFIYILHRVTASHMIPPTLESESETRNT